MILMKRMGSGICWIIIGGRYVPSALISVSLSLRMNSSYNTIDL
jgi:hypothetical protein